MVPIRDLKAGNILIDLDMNPKISYFGVARRFHGQESEANTNTVVGTLGYISPEYARGVQIEFFQKLVSVINRIGFFIKIKNRFFITGFGYQPVFYLKTITGPTGYCRILTDLFQKSFFFRFKPVFCNRFRRQISQTGTSVRFQNRL
ncbi:putative protein kinase RLK-Pelle-DLSV family [Helianthus annuus]|uniref:Protein kinase domain-containing protein n=1 Tax=Helianthus annuus TaxID=4232 RepID=A0A9K3E3N2_HELAN|nr:putative protein kinase RLK-Pelle-DLSV family [Helianthus annuus]KAJ0653985.1 putative protein kinase RLK-Pelle-DLSV family [Helianthus annuus]KAJ0833019.1 putative protein kinase RLK-Pelle-DLSV family [Helianthus annuus]KAJ0846587.1 putative protein kinase RLK-Pelle-DLSV family [Helianthus annuus]